MRIIFVARHNQANSNDDEGAITHALRGLGHEVHTPSEDRPFPEDYAASASVDGYDLCLFLKWRDPRALHRIKCPRAFWYFDMVDHPDPTLRTRCEARKAWMREMTPLVDVGFCTDGTWVDNDDSGKLVWLPQGADERVVGRGTGEPRHDVLFTGIGKGGGRERVSFVEELRAKYGERLCHVERGVHGRALAALVAQSRVVVAPDSPIADRYWSNRIYLMLGFGAFLLHPHCKGLRGHYTHGTDLGEMVYYNSRADLHRLIDYYLPQDRLRQQVGQAAIDRTVGEHLYRHRVAELLRVCKERGLVS